MGDREEANHHKRSLFEWLEYINMRLYTTIKLVL
jgi:hypothetical protein